MFEPVCGLDGTAYPNPCIAECHGAGIECEGKCPCEFDDEGNKDDKEDKEEKRTNIMAPAPTKCKTTNGEPCVFPFRYRQHYYTKCTSDYEDGKHWCATQVDEMGMMEKMGKCSDGCTTGKCECLATFATRLALVKCIKNVFMVTSTWFSVQAIHFPIVVRGSIRVYK